MEENLTEEQLLFISNCDIVCDNRKALIESFIKTNADEFESIKFLIFDLCVKYNDLQGMQFLADVYGLNLTDDPFSIIYACQNANFESFKFLIHRGASLQPHSTALMILAAMSGSVDILEYFRTSGYSLSAADDVVLISAVFALQEDVVCYLKMHGMDPNMNNNMLIIKACSENNINVLKMFLRVGLDICKSGIVSLSIAARNGFHDIIQLLIENGVNPREENLIAHRIAIEADCIESLKILCNFDCGEEDLKNLVHVAKPFTRCCLYLKQTLGLPFDDQFPFDFQISYECPICLELASLILPCRHSICTDCLMKLNMKLCPVCRLIYDFRYVKRISKK